MDVMTLNDDVIPIFISLIEPGFEEDQSLRFFSEIYGRFVYTVSRVDNDFVRDNFEILIKTYFSLCLNKDRVAQKSAVYNFPCFFKLMLGQDDEEVMKDFLKLYSGFFNNNDQDDEM